MTYPSPTDTWIDLPDGRRLAARSWRPETDAPAPAILEYLPYRKRDGTAPRDATTHPVFAAAGYACIRVDIAGTGDSDGLFDDEYSEQELTDGEAVIAWIARQPWCDGNVGMIGISWGGFNGLQLAFRRPPALEGDRHLLLHRGPLRRRHPLHGRLPVDRQLQLGRPDAGLPVPTARSGAARRLA